MDRFLDIGANIKLDGNLELYDTCLEGPSMEYQHYDLEYLLEEENSLFEGSFASESTAKKML